MDDRDFLHQLQKLGTQIRNLRYAKGFSQESFADACGLDRTYIGGIERGERNLGFKNLLRIAEALDVAPSELVAEISAKNRNN